jgi:hypothetical protein
MTITLREWITKDRTTTFITVLTNTLVVMSCLDYPVTSSTLISIKGDKYLCKHATLCFLLEKSHTKHNHQTWKFENPFLKEKFEITESWQYKHQSPRRKVQLNFHFHSSKLEIKHTLKGRSPLSPPQKLHGSHKQKNQLTANKKKIQLHMEATMLLTNYSGQIAFIKTSFFRMDKGNRNSKHLCNGLQTKPLLNGCLWYGAHI